MKITFEKVFLASLLLYSATKAIYKHEAYYQKLCGKEDAQTCKIVETEYFIYRLENKNERIVSFEEYYKGNLEERLNEIKPEYKGSFVKPLPEE